MSSQILCLSSVSHGFEESGDYKDSSRHIKRRKSSDQNPIGDPPSSYSSSATLMHSFSDGTQAASSSSGFVGTSSSGKFSLIHPSLRGFQPGAGGPGSNTQHSQHNVQEPNKTSPTISLANHPRFNGAGAGTANIQQLQQSGDINFALQVCFQYFFSPKHLINALCASALLIQL